MEDEIVGVARTEADRVVTHARDGIVREK